MVVCTNTTMTDFNKKFEGISTPEKFRRRFNELVFEEPTIHEPPPSRSSSEEQLRSLQLPAKQQKLSSKKGKPAMEHVVLMPATRRKEPISDDDAEDFDEDEMDSKIDDHYIGNKKSSLYSKA